MSAAQEREARRQRAAVLVSTPEPGGNRARSTQIAKESGGIRGKWVGKVPAVDFVLGLLEEEGLVENRAGWWRRTREGEKYVRTLR